MNGKVKSLWAVLFVTAGVLSLLVFVSGCGKEEPAAEQSSNPPAPRQLVAAAEETAAEAAETVAETIEQKECPVMGGPINTAIFVEHEGKKVYFCCKGCETQFQADPAKYVKLLPQFQD